MTWSTTQLHEARAIKEALAEYCIFSDNIETHHREAEYLYIFVDVDRSPTQAAPGLIHVKGSWRIHPNELYSTITHPRLARYDTWQAAVIAFKLLWTPKRRL